MPRNELNPGSSQGNTLGRGRGRGRGGVVNVKPQTAKSRFREVTEFTQGHTVGK